MDRKFILLLQSLSLLIAVSVSAKGVDDDKELPGVRGDIVEDSEGGQRRVIMYGTSDVYCGQGPGAEKPDDIGETAKVDACCKELNDCDLKIHKDKQRWGVKNILGFTVTDCRCDDKFSTCLKNVKAKGAGKKEQELGESIEQMYFDGLGTPCVIVPDGGDKNEPEIGIADKPKNKIASPGYLRMHRQGEENSNRPPWRPQGRFGK